MSSKINKEMVALQAVLCASDKEAAEKCGISERTLYRYRQDPGFQQIVKDISSRIFEETSQKAKAEAKNALKVLCDIMSDENANPQVRMLAACRVYDIALKHDFDESIISRFENLEGLLNDEK